MAKRKAPRAKGRRADVPRAKAGRGKGTLSRRRSNAAYRRANRERVEAVESAIEKALAEGAKLREAISSKIERKIAAAESRERRATRRRR